MNIRSIAFKIDVGDRLVFNIPHQTIQVYSKSSRLNPLRWRPTSSEYTCLFINDEDSCFQIACLIGAITGYLISEGKRIPHGIVYEFVSEG